MQITRFLSSTLCHEAAVRYTSYKALLNFSAFFSLSEISDGDNLPPSSLPLSPKEQSHKRSAPFLSHDTLQKMNFSLVTLKVSEQLEFLILQNAPYWSLSIKYNKCKILSAGISFTKAEEQSTVREDLDVTICQAGIIFYTFFCKTWLSIQVMILP